MANTCTETMEAKDNRMAYVNRWKKTTANLGFYTLSIFQEWRWTVNIWKI